MDIANALVELDNAIARGGVREALAFLNSLSGHRYTALYRFDGSMLHNLYFYDRLNPDVEDTDDFPVEVTYCVFVRDSRRPFVVEDALHDVRVDGHPALERVKAYCGVPLVDGNGRVFATLCHFDSVPVTIAEPHTELMEAMAPRLGHQAAKRC